MPRIRIDQTAPSAQLPLPNTRASGEDFGAGIGRALSSFGSAVSGLGGTLAQKQKQKEDLDDSLLVTQHGLNESRKLIEMEANAPPGAEGLTDTFDSQYQATSEQLLEGKTGERAERLKLRLEQKRATLVNQAATFEAAQTAAFRKNQIQTTVDDTVNLILADPSQYDSALTDMDPVFSAMGLDGNTETALRQDFEQRAARARFRGLMDGATIPEQVDDFIGQLKEEDKWRDVLDTTQFEALLNYGEQRKSIIEGGLLSSAKKSLNEFKNMAARGMDIPTAKLEEIEQTIAAADDPVLEHEYVTLTATYEQERTLFGSNPAAVQKERERLNSRRMNLATHVRQRAEAGVGVLMKAGGLTQVQAAGVIGNLISESQLDSTNDTGDNNTAHGIAQWRKDRFTRLQTFAKARNKPWTDYQTQLQYVIWEMRNFYPEQWKQLTNATTVEEATEAMISYERPQGWTSSNPRGGHNWAGRLNNAKMFADGDIAMSAGQLAQIDATERYAANMQKGLQDDPLAYAQSQGVQDYTPISMDDPASFSQRSAEFAKIEEYYNGAGVPIDKIFTSSELTSIKEAYENGDSSQRMDLLKSIGGMGDYTETALKQLGKDDPTIAATAAMAVYGDPQIAQSVIRGQIRYEADSALAKDLLGKPSDRRQALTDYTGTALMDRPGVVNSTMELADALYLSRKRDGAFDSDAYRSAIRDVLGGEPVGVGKSGTVLTPPGMSGDEFETFVHNMTPDDLVLLSRSGRPPIDAITGEPTDPEFIRENTIWRNPAPGQYYFTNELDQVVIDDTKQTYIMEIDRVKLNAIGGRERKAPEGGPHPFNK